MRLMSWEIHQDLRDERALSNPSEEKSVKIIGSLELKGMELGKVSHPDQEERRPEWPFRLRLCKWEFRKFPNVGWHLLYYA